MDKGELVMTGTPREVFAERDRLRAYGLAVPEVTTIAAELGLPVALTVEELIDGIIA